MSLGDYEDFVYGACLPDMNDPVGHWRRFSECQQKVVDIYAKKGGALWFVVSETELKDQAGKPVAKAKGITVVRNPDAAKK